MILFLILQVDELNIKKLNEMILTYQKTKDENIEKEFLKIYNRINPLGFDIYIEYLLLKKDNKKIKEEMKNIINKLKFENEFKDTLRQMYIYRGVFNAIIRLKDEEDFYKNLLEFIRITENKPLLIPGRKKPQSKGENQYKIEIMNLLSRYSIIDSLVKYQELDNYITGDLLKNVKGKREENKRKEKLLIYLKIMNQDSAILYTKSDYEKALVYSYFGNFGKAEGIFKMEYKNKDILPLFILLKSRDEKDIKYISLKLLGSDVGLPEKDLARLFYSLIFDTTLQFKDIDLEPYLMYLEIEDGKSSEDNLLKKYPDTSPAFIIRNRRK